MPSDSNPPEDHSISEAQRWRQFALMVAHDLKEPIRNMGDCARLLNQSEELSGVEPAQLQEWILAASIRLQDMLESLLDHARNGREPFQYGVDSEAILEDILQDFRFMIQRTGGEIKQITPMPKVDCGPLGLRLVLQNLIENALKYHRQGMAPVVTVGAHRVDTEWVFEVADEGMGMPEGRSIEAFDPFKRFTHQREGLGMGLCHVRHIVESHGGRIWIESRKDVGTKVSFTFPAAVRTEIGTPELQATGCPKT